MAFLRILRHSMKLPSGLCRAEYLWIREGSGIISSQKPGSPVSYGPTGRLLNISASPNCLPWAGDEHSLGPRVLRTKWEKAQRELSTRDCPQESPQWTFAIVITITLVIHNYGPSVWLVERWEKRATSFLILLCTCFASLCKWSEVGCCCFFWFKKQ